MTVDRWAASAGLDLNLGRAGGVTPLPVDAEPPQTSGRSYRRLTLADRAFIQAALAMPEPWSMRRIATELAVSASTVSREVRAHSVTDWGEQRYSADVAHYRALRARPRSQVRKLDDPELRGEVKDLLNLKYSPEQVAAELKIMFPDRKEMHISHETIYQELYVQGRGALRDELRVVKALRTGRAKRKPRSKLPARNTRPWLDGARLSERPAEVNDRAVPGHWEGDLVVGPDNSGLVTLVERSSRYVLIGHLPGGRDSAR